MEPVASNGKPRGLSPRDRSKAICEIMRSLGPEVAVSQVDEELAKIGEGPVVRTTFISNYCRVYGTSPNGNAGLPARGESTETPNGAVPRVEPNNGTVTEILEDNLNKLLADDQLITGRLSIYARLIVLVKDIGGVKKTRQYLDLIERMLRIQ